MDFGSFTSFADGGGEDSFDVEDEVDMGGLVDNPDESESRGLLSY